MNLRISGQKINIVKEAKYLGLDQTRLDSIQTIHAYNKLKLYNK